MRFRLFFFAILSVMCTAHLTAAAETRQSVLGRIKSVFSPGDRQKSESFQSMVARIQEQLPAGTNAIIAQQLLEKNGLKSTLYQRRQLTYPVDQKNGPRKKVTLANATYLHSVLRKRSGMVTSIHVVIVLLDPEKFTVQEIVSYSEYVGP